ncbi:MAG: DUF1249 domain-containing protein [Congregibacter sp.]
MIKSGYKVDLRALHALCEANYARLLRLFPDYESRNVQQFSVAGAQVHVEVIERSRYTTLFRLQCFHPSQPSEPSDAPVSANKLASNNVHWLPPLNLEVRAYHDASMLEVIGFQSVSRLQGRYTYPNPAMHQRDEKFQQNTFLADWFSHCLHNGETELPGLLKPGAEHA